jgi:hypothetical protein
MADITFAAVGQRFVCGHDYENLMVIEFKGPNGAKIDAYCCNMNLDFDGQPQAYAPINHPANIKPQDNLGNAGYLWPAENEALRARFESLKNQIAALETQEANAKTDQGKLDLQKQIDQLKKADILTNYKTAKNYGKKFWLWYGVKAISAARKKEVHQERLGLVGNVLTWAYGLDKPITHLPRNPDPYDKDANYEDVNGEFPVVQSVFEPGPGYFVSTMPTARNKDFPDWDQRYYLPPGAMIQGPYGALTVPSAKYPALPSLSGSTGLKLGDAIFAVRLDKVNDLIFPFRDTGYGAKVGECSVDAYVGMGGVIKYTAAGKAYYDNEFPILYLAFPNGQTPQSALAHFATASNALEFPVILGLLAKITRETPRAKKGNYNPHTVTRDPFAEFKQWQKSFSQTIGQMINQHQFVGDIAIVAAQILPANSVHIANALRRAGFNPPNIAIFAQP